MHQLVMGYFMLKFDSVVNESIPNINDFQTTALFHIFFN